MLLPFLCTLSSILEKQEVKQPTVSKSSSEAEYMAMALAICEAQLLLYLFDTIDRHCSYCDNQANGENRPTQ